MKKFYKLATILILVLYSVNMMAQTRKHDAVLIQDNPKLQWWKDARYGMFIHWGPVTLMGGEISWARAKYGKAKYDSLYLRFNPIKFNAKEWVRIAQNAGMKYMVFTAKHCDGFCNWDTKTIDYNIMKTPFGRDVCKELADAAHEAGMPICWYFSTPDWKDPDCRNPKTYAVFEKRILEQLRELLTNYGKISLLWTDFDGWAPPTSASKVYQLAQQLQPGIIVNNRLDAFHSDESHSHIGENGDYATPEGFVANFGSVPWETCFTLGAQWSWKFNDHPKSLPNVATTLLRCVGGNGNLLLDIGPDSLGLMPADFVNRLQEINQWIKPRSAAIYGSKGGPYLPSENYVCTSNGNTIYVHLFNQKSDTIQLPAMPLRIKMVKLINGKPLTYIQKKDRLLLMISANDRENIATTVAITVNKPAKSISLIPPFSTSGSLAYHKKAKASSEMGQFLHDASAAFDDNPNTYWKLGRKTDADFEKYYGSDLFYRGEEIKKLYNNSGWLEVDLGKPKLVGEVSVMEYNFSNSEIKRFEIQYKEKEKWMTLATGTKMGEWKQTVTPVSARYFRLVIDDENGFCGIKEFQLFPPLQNQK